MEGYEAVRTDLNPLQMSIIINGLPALFEMDGGFNIYPAGKQECIGRLWGTTAEITSSDHPLKTALADYFGSV